VRAALNEHERFWLEDVAVGDAIVKLGLTAEDKLECATSARKSPQTSLFLPLTVALRGSLTLASADSRTYTRYEKDRGGAR
jgi:hypothetical protein